MIGISDLIGPLLVIQPKQVRSHRWPANRLANLFDLDMVSYVLTLPMSHVRRAGMTICGPAVGIGYRPAISAWTRENLDRFDALEITVDHCLAATRMLRSIFDRVGRIPLTLPLSLRLCRSE
jgi:hypothetical protein